MAGNSSTTLNAGALGDLVYDEDIGGGIKMPASKIHTGALGVDGGPVTTANPLPTQDQRLPTSLSPQGRLTVETAYSSTSVAAVPIAGWQVYTGNGTIAIVFGVNTSGVAAEMMLFSSVSQPVTGTQCSFPNSVVGTVANNGIASLPGAGGTSISIANARIAWSTTAHTYTAVAANTNAYAWALTG